jgi:hypothetical protein
VLDTVEKFRHASRMKMSTFTAFVVGFALTLSLRAADQSASEVKPSEAAQHIGQNAKVTGKVDSVHKADGGSIFLDMEGRHPNNAFTVFIPAKAADKFTNYTDYEGKTITVSGTIAEHDNKPQIIAKDPSQITVK